MPAPYTPTFAEKVKFSKGDRVIVYYGRNGLDRDFFCYIRLNLDGYKKIQEDYINKSFADVEEYGEVIYKDFIKEPDVKAQEFLKKWLEENNGIWSG